MMGKHENKGRLGRAVKGLLAVLMLGGVLVACGGAQMPPPAEGNCNDGREWVPPSQDADGTWHTGYCQEA